MNGSVAVKHTHLQISTLTTVSIRHIIPHIGIHVVNDELAFLSIYALNRLAASLLIKMILICLIWLTNLDQTCLLDFQIGGTFSCAIAILDEAHIHFLYTVSYSL